jgi:hypothetical protein
VCVCVCVWVLSLCNFGIKIVHVAELRWLTSVILATQETEVRRIMVQSPISKNPITKMGWWIGFQDGG